MLPDTFVVALGMLEYLEEDFVRSRLVHIELDLLIKHRFVAEAENLLIVGANSAEARDSKLAN